ncbi:SDR family NAD(P)-dependent oxidoreductase [Embleya scabrispora]|uniref:SDR family NAD(P)-dependent oxidoreductase n=1 Tax=Embleya scabrispora TaxID=159449 RepID=UPI000371C23C|nr:SDR family NAD(P)-dependent oxidoreductase [Embleya scabrispora]MYS84870.1 SDR family NAD(P)-dependent oxidoreductase [Streptomyces sp. SID5474]
MSTALVTGASCGLGADLARALAARGHDLVLVARGAEALDRLAADLTIEHGIKAHALPADLTVEADLEQVAAAACDIDILINNAGAALGASFDRTAWADEQRMLALNVVAPSRLVHAALPEMLRRGVGRILTVSSVAAVGPAWQGTAYGAAKAYELAMTQSFAYSRRVRTSPVALTALVLGYMASQFHVRAGVTAPPPLLTLASPYVAKQAVRAIHRRRPPVVCVPSMRYKVLAGLLRHAPYRSLTMPGLAKDFTTGPVGAHDRDTDTVASGRGDGGNDVPPVGAHRDGQAH